MMDLNDLDLIEIPEHLLRSSVLGASLCIWSLLSRNSPRKEMMFSPFHKWGKWKPQAGSFPAEAMTELGLEPRSGWLTKTTLSPRSFAFPSPPSASSHQNLEDRCLGWEYVASSPPKALALYLLQLTESTTWREHYRSSCCTDPAELHSPCYKGFLLNTLLTSLLCFF